MYIYMCMYIYIYIIIIVYIRGHLAIILVIRKAAEMLPILARTISDICRSEWIVIKLDRNEH